MIVPPPPAPGSDDTDIAFAASAVERDGVTPLYYSVADNYQLFAARDPASINYLLYATLRRSVWPAAVGLAAGYPGRVKPMRSLTCATLGSATERARSAPTARMRSSSAGSDISS